MMTETCKAALETWGSVSQINMVFEEMSELQKELCKNLRGKANALCIAEEIADVQIMLEQMIILYNCRGEVEDWKTIKLLRLRRSIEDNSEKGGWNK